MNSQEGDNINFTDLKIKFKEYISKFKKQPPEYNFYYIITDLDVVGGIGAIREFRSLLTAHEIRSIANSNNHPMTLLFVLSDYEYMVKEIIE